MNTDAIKRWAESVGITPRVDGGLVEHVVHEVTHAVLLGLLLTDGLSERIDDAIIERVRRGWDSRRHEALCLASESVSLRLLGLSDAVVAEHNAGQDAREYEDEREYVEEVDVILLIEAAAQGVVPDFNVLVGSDQAKEVGENVAAVLRKIGEDGWN